MTDPFQVLSSERGAVRVFTSDLDAEGSSAVTPANVHRLLGADLDLDPSRIEVFPSTVLEAMGLSTYLQEGYGIPPEDLRGVAAALDSMKGLVILVASSAFKGKSAELEPNASLRFVGVFQEPATEPPTPMAAPKAATGPFGDTKQQSPQATRRGSAWPIAFLLILCAAALAVFLLI